MSDLFSDAAQTRLLASAPLAARLRPRTLDDLVGHEAVIGPGSALRRAIETDRVRSAIFHGPPGSGKTTLARIVAGSTEAAFEELSAVSATVSDVRAVLDRARERLGGSGRRTVLFLDEIHRFNRAQQDALLPAVEEGLVVLLGATTENPYAEVNAALLSRCLVYRLEALSLDTLGTIADRGARELGARLDDDARELLLRRAGGDARTALTILELAHEAAAGTIDASHVEDAARKQPLRYDRAGDPHYDYASALIKAIRASDADAAVYYLAAMLEGGEDPRFLARRLIVHASEDIGLADPQALPIAIAAAQAVDRVGLPEARINLAHATLHLARAPKSNSVIVAIDAAIADVRREGALPPPVSLRDAHSRAGRALGHGASYIYPHDDPAGFELDLLPETIRGRRYHVPSGHGADAGPAFGRRTTGPVQ